jgi:hypothetical protein
MLFPVDQTSTRTLPHEHRCARPRGGLLSPATLALSDDQSGMVAIVGVSVLLARERYGATNPNANCNQVVVCPPFD